MVISRISSSGVHEYIGVTGAGADGKNIFLNNLTYCIGMIDMHNVNSNAYLIFVYLKV